MEGLTIETSRNTLLKVIEQTGNGATHPYALAGKTVSVVFRTGKTNDCIRKRCTPTHTSALHTTAGDTYVNVAHPKKVKFIANPVGATDSG